MVGVSIKSDGIKYLFYAIEKYMGISGYVLLFFVLLIYLIINGSEKEKRIFIPVGITMGLTVYNPVFPLLLAIVTDVSSEYYRFFWITPVIILIPYVITKIVIFICDKNSDVKVKDKVVIGVMTALILFFASNFLYQQGVNVAQNIYKVPDELIEISEIIHKDCPDEYPKAFLEYEYNMMMRQYDPKMLLTIDREDYVKAVSTDFLSEEIYDDMNPQYRILAVIARGQKVENPNLLAGFELSGTEYVVLTKGNFMVKRLEDAGLSIIAETQNHTILKYNLEERKPFELIDYSEIYEQGL